MTGRYVWYAYGRFWVYFWAIVGISLTVFLAAALIDYRQTTSLSRDRDWRLDFFGPLVTGLTPQSAMSPISSGPANFEIEAEGVPVERLDFAQITFTERDGVNFLTSESPRRLNFGSESHIVSVAIVRQSPADVQISAEYEGTTLYLASSTVPIGGGFTIQVTGTNFDLNALTLNSNVTLSRAIFDYEVVTGLGQYLNAGATYLAFFWIVMIGGSVLILVARFIVRRWIGPSLKKLRPHLARRLWHE